MLVIHLLHGKLNGKAVMGLFKSGVEPQEIPAAMQIGKNLVKILFNPGDFLPEYFNNYESNNEHFLWVGINTCLQSKK